MPDAQFEDAQPFARAEDLRRYERPLRAFFRKRAGPGDDVDDLVQEVLFRVWSLAADKPISNPDGYIFQAAANLVNERFRKRGTFGSMKDQLRFIAPASEELTPERILQGKDELRLLEQVLGELPERTRTIFLLHRFEKFKYREIAGRLGISVSAVEKHIAAAMKHLLSRMEGF